MTDSGDEEEYKENAEEVDPNAGARPRRMSEINTKEKSKPIPPASSLFVFSSTNK